MIISMIAAMAQGRVIGKNNAMPWHLPADLRHFKQVTLNKPVVMGRRTYDSIGRALPGRRNIVISSQPELTLADAEVVSSPEQAMVCVGDQSEVMIIGGGRIYQHFLPLCHRLYLTHIDLSVDGDTRFPDYEAAYSWHMSEESFHHPDEKNAHTCHFMRLEKLNSR